MKKEEVRLGANQRRYRMKILPAGCVSLTYKLLPITRMYCMKMLLSIKKLPNVSTLYNELTPTQVDLMNNVLRQGLGQSAHKNHPV
ncbi:MAG: hypothetical protein J6N49_03130 [Alphaproteobacteria bacterium]|nr:hypothetical protein [Alphaproteobacteria bacterium]